MKKLISILVAFAMMAMLSITAFAAEGDPPTTALAEAKITKQLNTPDGVTDVPTILATFSFALDTANSSGLTNEEIAAANTDNDALAIDDQQITLAGAVNQTTTGTKALPAPTFTHAGVYAYTVNESAVEISAPANLKADTNAKVSKEDVTYTVRYYVVPATVGEGYTVKYVTVNRNAESLAGEAGKVDASKTDKDGFTFVDNYTYTDGEEPDDPDDPNTPVDPTKFALNVKKTVVDGTADIANLTYPIKVTLSRALGQTDEGVTGYVYGSDNKYVRTEEFTYDDTKTVNLAAGQYLAFPTLPTGTVWTASEYLNNAEAYLPFTPSFSGVGEGEAISGNAGAGQTLSTDEYTLQQAGKDNVTYSNKYDNSINTPTGILMNNLPYIVLALVAIGGLVAYVVVRRRNADEA